MKNKKKNDTPVIEEVRNLPPKSVPWIIACAFFMQMLDGTILNTALPSIAYSISESPLHIQSIIISYFLTVAFLLPLSGWLADRFGSRKIFGFAIIIFTVGSILCSMSNTLMQLVLARIFQAAGGALMVPVGRLIVLKIYPKDQLIRVLSLIVLPALIGPLLGPVIGGFIVEYYTWHWIFLINVPIGILCLWANFTKMPDTREEEIYPFDWAGFIPFAIATLLLCIATNDSKLLETSLLLKFAMIVVAAVFLSLYWIHARKKIRPLFSPKLLKIPSFTIGAITGIFSRIGITGLPYLAPLLLQVGLGISPSKAGMMILTLSISALIARYFVENVLNFFGYRNFLFYNTILQGLLFCCFGFINEQTPYFLTIILFYVVGTSNSFQFASMATLSLIDLPKRYSSEGNALTSVMMQIAATVGIGIAAAILNFFSLPGQSGYELLPAFHTTFIILGIFTILTSVNFLFTPKNAGKLWKTIEAEIEAATPTQAAAE